MLVQKQERLLFLPLDMEQKYQCVELIYQRPGLLEFLLHLLLYLDHTM